jgi:hypothetical protein
MLRTYILLLLFKKIISQLYLQQASSNLFTLANKSTDFKLNINGIKLSRWGKDRPSGFYYFSTNCGKPRD